MQPKGRTNTQEPRPGGSEINRNKQVGYHRVCEENALPDIESVVPIVRQQERVMDPERTVSQSSPTTEHGDHLREVLDGVGHEGHDQCGGDGTSVEYTLSHGLPQASDGLTFSLQTCASTHPTRGQASQSGSSEG